MRYSYPKIFLLLLISLPFDSYCQVDYYDTVNIGGIPQHLWINSKDEDLPILLFLHGGPGRSVMSFAEGFNSELIKHFTLVHWDQRGSGITKELNPGSDAISLELLQGDTKELASYLLKRFNQSRLFLVSHSWSSYIGFYMADKHPEMLHAYVAISPLIDQEEYSQLTLEMLKEWADKNKNDSALKELNAVNIPLATKEDLFFQQKWLFIHNEVSFAAEPGFKKEYYQWMDYWWPLLSQSFEVNLNDSINEITCPIFFIEGNFDKQRSHWLVKKFYESLSAEEKDFYWFTNSGHTVFNTEPDKLQNVLIEIEGKVLKKN